MAKRKPEEETVLDGTYVVVNGRVVRRIAEGDPRAQPRRRLPWLPPIPRRHKDDYATWALRIAYAAIALAGAALALLGGVHR